MEDGSDSVEGDNNELAEAICKNGNKIFSHSGVDDYSVYWLNEKYAVICEGYSGPYDSLNAALENNDRLRMVTPATESVDCDSLSCKAIAAKLHCDSDEPIKCEIKYEQWMFEKGVGFHRDILDKICEDGDIVYSHAWDTGSPGVSADVYSLYRLNEKYAAFCGEHLGPYDSFDAAMEDCGLWMVSPTTESINCDSLSSEEVAAKLEGVSSEPFEFKINDELWRFEVGTGFQRVELD